MISEQTNVYVFSGIIRNFFLGYPEVRDLDIVISRNRIVIPRKYISSLHVEKNSFGGRKYFIGDLKLDFWFLQDTWGIQEERKRPNVNTLIKSSFFNFSAIAYDFNNRKFIYTQEFRNFLSSNTLDIVYEKNPNIPLCIVNTIYYTQKFDLSIGDKLCIWFIKNYNNDVDYEPIQKCHWGLVRYSNSIILDFYNYLWKTSR